uniref:RHS repeat-associated core domain protein n=1 Tax=Eubacterium cellulosolvens (strain ATCC 43171 / JCM 9499 / 6) TaxID=633697 RepID=I5ASF0_EUBC6
MGIIVSKSKVAAQCESMIEAFRSEKDKLDGVNRSVDNFSQDSALQGKAWSALKQQMSDYALLSEGLLEANRSMIADCQSLSDAVASIEDDPQDEDKLESSIHKLNAANRILQFCKSIAEGAQGIGGGVSPTTSQAVWNTIETYQSMIEDNNRSIEKMQEKIRQLQTAETQTNYLFLDADMIFKVVNWGYQSVRGAWSNGSYHPDEKSRIDWRSALIRANAIADTRIKGNEMKSEFLSHDPVNLSNGNFVYDHVDLAESGVKPFFFARFYNSINSYKGTLGKDWNHNFEMQLRIEEGAVVVMHENGREETFRVLADGSYFCGHGSTNTMQKSGDSYILRTREGDAYSFDREGSLTGCDGKTRVSFTCMYAEDPEKKLVRVESNEGTYFSFIYDDKGMLSEINDQAGRRICFRVEEDLLKEVTDPIGNTLCYSYGSEGKIISMTDRSGIVTVQNEFDEKTRVKKQEFPDGTTMSFSYDETSDVVEQTERNGIRSSFFHDQRLRDIGHEDVNGKKEFKYNRLNQKTEVRDPDGKMTRYVYDSRGNRTQIINAVGVILSMEYNSQNKLTGVSIAGKRKVRNSYDTHGNLIETIDANGNGYRFAYDDQDHLIRTTCPNGGILQFERDERGNIVRMLTPDNLECTFTYDDCNRVIARTDANGNLTQIEYDVNNQPVAVTRSDGAVRRYRYNANERKTEIVDYDGGVIRMEYNKLNRISAFIDKEGRRTSFQYDAMWNLCRVCYPNGTSSAKVYDSSNRLVKTIDPAGGITSFTYNAMGWVTSKTKPNGYTMYYDYDDLGRMIKLYPDEDHVQTFVYDEENRITEIHLDDGSTILKKYDGNGNVTQITEPNGRVTNYKYNEMDLLVEMRRGDRVLVRYEYDNCSRPVSITDSQGRSRFYTYDGNGNIIRSKNALGFEVEYTYDSLNRPVCMKGSNGMSETISYDALGNVLSRTDAMGNTFRYTYTPSGKLASVTDPVGCVTEYTYDEMNRMTESVQYDANDPKYVPHNRKTYAYDNNNYICSITDDHGRTETYQYDEEGNVTEFVARDGKKISYTYDRYGRMLGAYEEDKELLHLAYGSKLRVSEVSAPDGNLSFGRDVLGRITDTVYPDGRSVHYGYGIDGHLTDMQYSNGDTVSYVYNEKYRLCRMVHGEDEILYRYQAEGLLSEKEYPNGIVQKYGYDNLGRLTDLKIEEQGKLRDRTTYEYDLQGNLSVSDRQIWTGDADIRTEHLTYGYDALGRLTQVMTDGELSRQYTYDAFGNRTGLRVGENETHYQYDAGNRLIKKTVGEDRFEYRYDPRGNLIEELCNDERIRDFSYNALGQLTEVSNYPANIRRTYSYDGLGFRTGMRTEKIDAAMPVETGGSNISNSEYQMSDIENWPDEEKDLLGDERFYLDYTRNYDNVLENLKLTDEEASGKPGKHHRIYLRDGKTAGFFAEDEKRYYLHDLYGSVIGEAFQTENIGSSLRMRHYNEYGLPENLCPGDGDIGFDGYVYDEASGGWRSPYRMYHPENGRFASEDLFPGVFDQPYSLNPYIFCYNNPMTMTDRDGCLPSAAEIDEDIANLNEEVLLPIAETTMKAAESLQEQARDIVGGVTKFGNEHKEITDKIVEYGGYVGRFVVDNFMGVRIGNILTCSPYSDEVMNIGGFERTADGQFHAKVDCPQMWFGYADLYDNVFKFATDAEAHKAAVTVGDESYCLWTWKGDYLNLGTGMEEGIYKASNPGGKTNVNDIAFWDCMRDNPTTMEMVMIDKNGRVLAYAPEKAHWWATAFNPYEYNLGKKALGSNTTVYAKLDLDGFDPAIRSRLFNAFKEKAEADASGRGSIDGMSMCFEENKQTKQYTIYYSY